MFQRDGPGRKGWEERCDSSRREQVKDQVTKGKRRRVGCANSAREECLESREKSGERPNLGKGSRCVLSVLIFVQHADSCVYLV